MKLISNYIELEKLQKGIAAFADVELDLEREDEKILLVRIKLEPIKLLEEKFGGGSRSYKGGNYTYEYDKIDREMCLPIIKQHVGEIVANKLFEDEEKMLQMIK